MRSLFVIVIAVLFFQNGAKACGTIDSRHARYFNAEDDNMRLNELRFMICDPIVLSYKNDERYTVKLLAMVKDALKRSMDLQENTAVLGADWTASYYRDLAYRLYLRFKLYKLSNAETADVLKSFDSIYNVPVNTTLNSFREIKETDWLATDDGLALGVMEYASMLKREVLSALNR